MTGRRKQKADFKDNALSIIMKPNDRNESEALFVDHRKERGQLQSENPSGSALFKSDALTFFINPEFCIKEYNLTA